MMKKAIRILAALLLGILVLSACGSDVVIIDKTTAVPDSGTDGFVFVTEGKSGKLEIRVDALMAPILEALGEPLQYFEAASCAFNGLDKMYTYAHYEIDTYPQADGDRVSSIFFRDDLIKTPEGLAIGSTKAEMEKLYGTAYTVKGTELRYEKNGMFLKIIVKDDRVASITYASRVLDD